MEPRTLPRMETPACTVDGYLAVLDSEIGGRPRRREELLAEVRAHLEDARAELLDQGRDRDAAEQEAIERFGDPRIVAAKLRSTGTVVYEEGVRSACLGLLVFCAAWGLSVTPLAGAFPLVVAVAAYPLGLIARLWERRRRRTGESVPRLVVAANGATAGYAIRVLAALAAVAAFVVPMLEHAAQLGWVAAGALAAVGIGWLVYTTTRAPRGRAWLSRRTVAGAMLAVAAVPMLGYTAAFGASVWPVYEPTDDARVTSCKAHDGTIAATVRITNHDDEPHGYLYSPQVVHRDRVIAHLRNSAGFVSVQPGETVTQQYSGVPRHRAVGKPQPLPGEPQPVPEHFTCRSGPAEMERDLHNNLP